MAQWQENLDRMEGAVLGVLKSLERAEERWELAVAPSAGEGETPATLDRLEARLREWEERLCAAGELTTTVEGELAERAAAVERWRALFATWEESLKREGHVSA